ncbi:MMPL family transporter [Streptomyces sp. 3MP-14]|uniref:MMPL family transporter n=1 Tax=Streptomyces mimosae TaxID=2586635 RepID=A0A5N6ADT2_9ACTN|nr:MULTISPECIES: MMPL family transporter [Streptomyces]KAB8166974.1 MMPL family transporter [Streptomyces mimosae]KAB8176915.1 MMPL family transporter [Streptomyces sp. 3MP-14]
MSTFLSKLGRLAFRQRHVFLLLWVALLTLAGVGALSAPAPTNSSFAIPGTEAQRAFDLLDERVPEAHADGASARVVFEAPEGGAIANPETRAAIERTIAELADSSPEVAVVADPFTAGTVSDDGRIAFASVTYDAPAMDLSDETRDALESTVEDARQDGLTVEVGGDALQSVPEVAATEVIGVAVAAVVLVVTFGSLVAAGLPLLTALIGVGVGVGGITALAGVLDLGSDTTTLAMMIGLAVGIDYALFIVSRYRSELRDGADREAAAGRAVGTAGSAVVFAGLTVVIALVGLAVVNIPILTKMGLAAAATVVIAVLIALTLIPALLGYAGDRVRPRAARGPMASARGAGADRGADGGAGANEGADGGRPALGVRWARLVLRRPVTVLLAAVVGLGVIALPATSMELGLPDDGTKSTDTTERRAYDLVSEGFGPGLNGPLLTVVDTGDAADPQAVADRVAATVDGLPGVATVTPATLNEAGDTALITVVPAAEPGSTETEDLVHAIRDAGGEIPDAEVLVTGGTAMNIDVSEKLDDALVPYLTLVVGLAFLLLTVVFRSLLVPLKAALGFLLSVLAALGAVVAVFQWGWLAGLIGLDQTTPIVSMMPLILVGVVFGLAMDYEVFLVTRMREALLHGEEPRQAVVTGFRDGARVVTAAAVIMIAVFAGFVGTSDPMIKMIGFGLAIAVLFDAFVVRMALVPAVLALLGRAAWWLPGWLDRLLPRVDVEGSALAGADPAGSAPEPEAAPGAAASPAGDGRLPVER